jgi:endonuclease G
MSLHSGGRSSASALPRFVALLLTFAIIFSALPKQFAPIIPSAHAASPDIVISQVYGGGGNANATLKNDFIELFNRGTSPVIVTGWSVQYGSATGTSWAKTDLTGTIQPGRYYLVQESAGAGGTTSLPAPEASGSIQMSATAGKVALVNNGTLLTCGTANNCLPNAAIKDLVGFGTGASGANSFEGSPTATLTNTTAAIRANGGCTDTDNNQADFATGAPTPRNSASPANPCGVVTNNPPTITAPANPIATVNQDAAPFSVSLTGSDDGSVYNWSATAGTGVSSVVVNSGQGTANVSYTVTLQPGFNGNATFTSSLTDNVNAAVTRVVNITVNPVVAANTPPTIVTPADPAATVAQDAAPFTVNLSGTDDNNLFNWSATAGTGVSSVVVTAGQGTAAVTYTVTLQIGFSGTAKFTASLSDGVNAPVTQVVNIAVTPAPASHVVISQLYGGGGNSGATYRNDYIELYNPTAQTVDLTGWSVQYGPATQTNWLTQSIAGPIGPNEYYLVKLASGGSTGAELPVLPNVEGTINMSATTAKVALVSSGVTLTGACPSDTSHLVDLVGYGAPNCHEGSANAPAPTAPNTNTTAIFRKQDGATDTNQNGNDFTLGVPNPRRTAIILDAAPTVTSADTDAEAGTSTPAPVDATVLLTFSEPVVVEGTWYDLSCVNTGSHTTTLAAGPKTWAITTDSNFAPGEQCTFKVFASHVKDADLDDSQPNTDFMQSDFSQTFTVVADATAPEGPDAHMVMGNPSGAVTDTSVPNNYLMMKSEYALSYNRSRGTANWVSWHLDDSWKGPAVRVDTFRPDPTLPADWYHVQHLDYTGSGFDRGHMTPSDDRDLSRRVNQATFLMTNIIPQAGDNNQGPWADMESDLRKLLPADELYIVAGGAGTGGTGSNGFTSTIADGHVTVPAQTWKVVLAIPKGDDDLARVGCGARTIAVIMPNTQGIRNNDWHSYITTVDAVEQLTGYDFFSNLPDAVENCVEAGMDGTNPPGTANQTVSTAEDTAAAITLTAVSPNANANFTYTVNTTPSHGTLSGTGASLTYTPAPNFTGTDNFTFTANDGARDSNTSTVTITVTDVNDAPVAADDSRSTQEDTTLSFLAGELLINDNAGAADEGGQTLAVASVADGADTHGTVSLADGQITYTPAANYHGAASFTYQVCDDGTTAGSPDPRCASATVNITVESVNDSPEAHADAATTDEDTPVTVDVVANDTDVDGESLTLASVADATHGTVTVADGKAVFTPAANYNGAASFSYVVSDGQGGTATGNVSITVNPVNDAPTLSGVPTSATINELVAYGFTASAGDIDTPAQTLTFSLVGAPAGASINASSGVFSWTPTEQQGGTNVPFNFKVRVSDGVVSTDADISLLVSEVNQAPTLAPIGNQTVALGDTLTFAAVGSDVDVPVQTLSYSLAGAVPAGATINAASGAFSWTPNAAQSGLAYTFSVVVTDGVSQTATTITVIVVGPLGIGQGALSQLRALRQVTTDKQDAKKLGDAIEELSDALNPIYWVDAAHLQSKHGDKFFGETKDAVNKLAGLLKDNKSAVSKAALQGIIDQLVRAARLVAQVAVGESAAAGGDQNDIVRANDELTQGDADAVGDKPEGAIEHYRKAWQQVSKK